MRNLRRRLNPNDVLKSKTFGFIMTFLFYLLALHIYHFIFLADTLSIRKQLPRTVLFSFVNLITLEF